MTTYSYEYKCRRCGELDYNPHTGNEQVAFRGLMEAILDTDYNEGMRVHLFGTHLCKDGGKGITDLQGYRKESK